jgi:1-acyl-sn-glycerol-3-phosphate acyltransferase
MVALAPVSMSAANRLFRTWGRVLRRLLGVELELESRAPLDPHRAYAFVLLNQTSLVESMLAPEFLCTGRRFRTFANIEFLLMPLLGWAMWATGSIPVVRQWPAQRRRALDRAKAAMARGDSIYISMEGARSPAGLLPYKSGPVRLALAAGAPLVPIVIHGARERLPLGQWRVRPGRVRVVLHEPIPTVGLSDDDVASLVARLRALAERELEG